MKHPIYTAFVIGASFFLFLANLRGWTLFPPASPSISSGPGRSGIGFHK